MDTLFYIFAVLVFAAVILLIEGAYLWWSDHFGASATRIGKRLRLMSGGSGADAEQVSILKQRRYANGPELDAMLHALPLTGRIDRVLVQSGLPWRVSRFLGMSLCGFAASLALMQMLKPPPLAAVVLVLLLVSIPYVMVVRARQRRLRKIEEQLPEAADFISRALRAGHSFTNVLHMTGSELPEPLASEFRIAHEEINYGVPMSEALQSLATRIPLTDLRYLVIAVLIQRESGGNLAEILASISHIIRQRLQLRARVRVLSAEGRMSAWVLGILPAALTGLLYTVNPKYMSILWKNPTGITALWISAGLLLAGVFWLRKIIHIRV
jgi:tight adherence protein B